MKHLLLLCDGMSDFPLPELDGKTPMTVANKPVMNRLAGQGFCGMVRTVSHGFAPGSDVANLAVMGYDPTLYYTGRSPLEAASIGIEMAETDIALRCNLVTLSEDEPFDQKTMLDYCADDIPTEQAHELIRALQEALGDDEFSFHAGVSYRHCLIWHGGTDQLGTLTPPHDITGRVITEHLPAFHGQADTCNQALKIRALMEKSVPLLNDHPINRERIANGLRPANAIWLWGEGKRAFLPSFQEKTGLSGGIISAVDLLKGIGKLASMQVIEVPGATGYIDTNFAGKAEACINAFEEGLEFVYLHVEAPDECGHRFEVDNKVLSLEHIDEKVLTPVLSYLEQTGEDFKIMILPDHATPLTLRTHVSDPVPFLVYQQSKANKGQEPILFDEEYCQKTKVLIDPGYTILSYFTAF